jgi:hypothetical protein
MARPLAAVAKKVAGSNRRLAALGLPSVSIFAMQHFSPIAAANLCKIAHFVQKTDGVICHKVDATPQAERVPRHVFTRPKLAHTP